MSKVTPVTATVAGVTVKAQVAVLPPSTVVTVIVAVPAFLAETTPEEDTVATVVLLEDQVTLLFVALEGATVATKVWVSPSVKVRLVWFRVTPVTAMTFFDTMTTQVAIFASSFVFTVMAAVPGDTAVTRPEEETVATSLLLETQVTDLSVALEGVTVAVRE